MSETITSTIASIIQNKNPLYAAKPRNESEITPPYLGPGHGASIQNTGASTCTNPQAIKYKIADIAVEMIEIFSNFFILQILPCFNHPIN